MADALEDEDLTPVDGVTMEERERIEEIIGILLEVCAREAGKPRTELSLETEQVVTRGCFEAYRLGRRQKRSSSGVLDAVAKGKDPEEQ